MKKILTSAFIIALLLVYNKGFAQDDTKTYNFIAMETPPKFPGGMAAFYKFLSTNIKYPKAAVENNIQGTVKVSFTIEKDGSITDPVVMQSAGSGLDEEALRVMRLSPKWNPGMQEGKLVRVKYNLPIKFALGARRKN
jgi:protein TonB